MQVLIPLLSGELSFSSLVLQTLYQRYHGNSSHQFTVSQLENKTWKVSSPLHQPAGVSARPSPPSSQQYSMIQCTHLSSPFSLMSVPFFKPTSLLGREILTFKMCSTSFFHVFFFSFFSLNYYFSFELISSSLSFFSKHHNMFFFYLLCSYLAPSFYQRCTNPLNSA